VNELFGGSGDVSANVQFYALLYIDDRHREQQNVKPRGKDIFDVYLKCASLTFRSFKAQGLRFSLITNKPDYVEARLRFLGIEFLPIRGCVFDGHNPPDDAMFYSAHFKVDLFPKFASGSFGDLVGLIDIDTVLLRAFPGELLSGKKLVVYDITEQVAPVYGRHVIREDLELISGAQIDAPQWFGGEFIFGSCAQYRQLSDLLELCWHRYIENYTHLHHIGDEMVVSAALSLLARGGVEIVDGGRMQAVTRWWTVRTGHAQMTFQDARNASLLHLPADKLFLSMLPGAEPFCSERFLMRYIPYARRRLFLRRLLSPANCLLAKGKAHVASLD
jgi:hypothetical protein